MVAACAVGAFALVVYGSLVVSSGGVAPGTIRTSWQLLDLGQLEEHPVRSLWLLHTQPPLYNTLAAVLTFLPFPVATSLTVVFGAAFVATALLCFDLVRRLGAGPVVAAVATALAVGNPNLLSTVTIASYEVLVALLVVGVLWLLLRYLSTGRDGVLVALSVVLTVGALTRSLLHPAWVAVILAVALLARRPARRRTWVVALAVPAVLLGALVAKNAAVFGEPTLSTWSGFNAQRGIVAPMTTAEVDDALADGDVTPVAGTPPWLALDAYPTATEGCVPGHDDPVTADPTKDQVGVFDVPNFNHECYLPVYDESSANASALLRRDPGRYVATRGPILAFSFATTFTGVEDPGPSPVGGTEPGLSWMDRVYRPLLAPVTVELDQSDWNLPLFPGAPVRYELSLTLLAAYLVVGVVAASRLVRLLRRWRAPAAWAAADVTWVVVGLTAAMVVVGGALVEFGENGRFRSALDPLVVALALAATIRAAAAVTGRAMTRKGDVTTAEGEKTAWSD